MSTEYYLISDELKLLLKISAFLFNTK